MSIRRSSSKAALGRSPAKISSQKLETPEHKYRAMLVLPRYCCTRQLLARASRKTQHTHHDVVSVEDRDVLVDLSRHADEFWCDQAADGKHGDATVLFKGRRSKLKVSKYIVFVGEGRIAYCRVDGVSAAKISILQFEGGRDTWTLLFEVSAYPNPVIRPKLPKG